MFEKIFKDFKIQFEDRNTYLYAFVSGETDSLEISNQYWTELINECKNTNHNQLLVVEEFKNQVSTMEMYKVGEHIARLFGHKPFKVAFVDTEIEHNELNKFAENVVRNRGTAGRIFNSIEDAEKWLGVMLIPIIAMFTQL